MDPRAPPQVVGRYAIYGKIASGGMASVHFGRLAGAAGFSRTVAVKRLHAHLAEDPEFRSTMIDEARLAARIHHPNVVPTLDIVAANGELLVIMEYVRGESLARLIRVESSRGGRVPLPIASAIVIGVLHGLHAAHEATSDGGTPLGIVHRDVSPQNILVGVDGVARVIDFGVAKAAGRLQTTSDGAIKGKVGYMAPEQLAAGDPRLSSGEVTRAADIYAVGALFWEILSGRRLFPGDSDARRALQVLIGAADPPSRYARDLPPPLDGVVMKALALDPGDRFGTALEMADLLLRIVPPAFSTDVGKWVEDVAGDALARRGAELAQIESLSELRATTPVTGGVTRVVGRGYPWASASAETAIPVATSDDVQTVSSQPSTLSVETPRSSPAHPAPPRRARVTGALGGVLLIAAGIATLLGPGALSHLAARPSVPTPAGVDGDASVGPVTASAPSSPPVSPVLPVPPARVSEEVAAPTSGEAPPVATEAVHAPPIPSATAAGAPTLRPPSPSRPRPKPRPPSRGAAPFRFAQPD